MKSLRHLVVCLLPAALEVRAYVCSESRIQEFSLAHSSAGRLLVAPMCMGKNVQGGIYRDGWFHGPVGLTPVADKNKPSTLYFTWSEDLPFGLDENGNEGRIYITRVAVPKTKTDTDRQKTSVAFDGFIISSGIDISDDGIIGTLCYKHKPSWITRFTDAMNDFQPNKGPWDGACGPLIMAVCMVNSKTMQKYGNPWRIGRHYDRETKFDPWQVSAGHIGHKSLLCGGNDRCGFGHLSYTPKFGGTWTAYYSATAGSHAGYAMHTFYHSTAPDRSYVLSTQQLRETGWAAAEDTGGVEVRKEPDPSSPEVTWDEPGRTPSRADNGEHHTGGRIRYHPLLGDLFMGKHQDTGPVFLEQYGLAGISGMHGDFYDERGGCHGCGRVYPVNPDNETSRGRVESGFRPCGQEFIMMMAADEGSVCFVFDKFGAIKKWNRLNPYLGGYSGACFRYMEGRIATLGSRESDAKCGADARFLIGMKVQECCSKPYKKWIPTEELYLTEVDGNCVQRTTPLKVTDKVKWPKHDEWTTTAEGAVAFVAGWAKTDGNNGAGVPKFGRFGNKAPSSNVNPRYPHIRLYESTKWDWAPESQQELQLVVYWPSELLEGQAQATMRKMLELQNGFRCMHRVPYLRWTEALVTQAQAWARFHANQASQPAVSSAGKNYATTNSNNFQGAVLSWYNSIQNTAGSGFGDLNSLSAQTQSYAQLVWNNSAEVGCAVAQAGSTFHWVCLYDDKADSARADIEVLPPTREPEECAVPRNALYDGWAEEMHMQVKVVSLINAVRCIHDVPSIELDPSVRQSAQAWVNQMRSSGRGSDFSGALGSTWAVTGTDGTISGVLESWYNQIEASDPWGAPTKILRSGQRNDAFVQLVWKGARKVACATSMAQGRKFWGCLFDKKPTDAEIKSEVQAPQRHPDYCEIPARTLYEGFLDSFFQQQFTNIINSVRCLHGANKMESPRSLAIVAQAWVDQLAENRGNNVPTPTGANIKSTYWYTTENWKVDFYLGFHAGVFLDRYTKGAVTAAGNGFGVVRTPLVDVGDGYGQEVDVAFCRTLSGDKCELHERCDWLDKQCQPLRFDIYVNMLSPNTRSGACAWRENKVHLRRTEWYYACLFDHTNSNTNAAVASVGPVRRWPQECGIRDDAFFACDFVPPMRWPQGGCWSLLDKFGEGWRNKFAQLDLPPPTTTPPPTEARVEGVIYDELRAEILDGHNYLRCLYDAPALTWSNDLAMKAKEFLQASADERARVARSASCSSKKSAGGSLSDGRGGSAGSSKSSRCRVPRIYAYYTQNAGNGPLFDGFWEKSRGATWTSSFEFTHRYGQGAGSRDFGAGNKFNPTYQQLLAKMAWYDKLNMKILWWREAVMALWSTTTQIGCAEDDRVWVCVYNPSNKWQGVQTGVKSFNENKKRNGQCGTAAFDASRSVSMNSLNQSEFMDPDADPDSEATLIGGGHRSALARSAASLAGATIVALCFV